MNIEITDSKNLLGQEAALRGAHYINDSIKTKGEANVAFVSGLSQIETLKHLSRLDISWNKVNIFLLDEYLGLDDNHKGTNYSFLYENLLSKVGTVKSILKINKDIEKAEKTLSILNKIMPNVSLDVAFTCIGENGHLALNDPPASLWAEAPYILVNLDSKSRRQQVSEGWFSNLSEVPEKAITMSIPEILKTSHIICPCPDQRKAKAVASTLFGEISPNNPAASLRMGKDVNLILDRQSSYLILSDRRT